MVVEALARTWGVENEWKARDGARQLVSRPHRAVLVEPQTFMNVSGEPTQRIAAWHKIAPAQILVVVDDLDLPFGKLRMRERGSSGGHNGLKSLIAHLGADFPRLRIGIGRDSSGEAIERVLGTFGSAEDAGLPAIIDASVRGINFWLTESSVTAINFTNSYTLAG